eukprot:5724574-Pyramimonas_sp.AAC.1
MFLKKHPVGKKLRDHARACLEKRAQETECCQFLEKARDALRDFPTSLNPTCKADLKKARAAVARVDDVTEKMKSGAGHGKLSPHMVKEMEGLAELQERTVTNAINTFLATSLDGVISTCA